MLRVDPPRGKRTLIYLVVQEDAVARCLNRADHRPGQAEECGPDDIGWVVRHGRHNQLVGDRFSTTSVIHPKCTQVTPTHLDQHLHRHILQKLPLVTHLLHQVPNPTQTRLHRQPIQRGTQHRHRLAQDLACGEIRGGGEGEDGVEGRGLSRVGDEGGGEEDEGGVGEGAGGVEDHAGEEVVVFDAEGLEVVLHSAKPPSAREAIFEPRDGDKP